MSGNESMKDKLVNSMKLTKQGTAKTTTASEIKEEPVVKKASEPAKAAVSTPAKKAAVATSFTSRLRVWPD